MAFATNFMVLLLVVSLLNYIAASDFSYSSSYSDGKGNKYNYHRSSGNGDGYAYSYSGAYGDGGSSSQSSDGAKFFNRFGQQSGNGYANNRNRNQNPFGANFAHDIINNGLRTISRNVFSGYDRLRQILDGTTGVYSSPPKRNNAKRGSNYGFGGGFFFRK